MPAQTNGTSDKPRVAKLKSRRSKCARGSCWELEFEGQRSSYSEEIEYKCTSALGTGDYNMYAYGAGKQAVTGRAVANTEHVVNRGNVVRRGDALEVNEKVVQVVNQLE